MANIQPTLTLPRELANSQIAPPNLTNPTASGGAGSIFDGNLTDSQSGRLLASNLTVPTQSPPAASGGAGSDVVSNLTASQSGRLLASNLATQEVDEGLTDLQLSLILDSFLLGTGRQPTDLELRQVLTKLNRESLAYLYWGLKDNQLSKASIIVSSLDLMTNRDLAQAQDLLVALGLALRSSEDNELANLYANVPGYGQIHILALAQLKVKDPNLLVVITLMLLLAGADPNRRAYRDVEAKSGLSVLDWVVDKGLTSPLPRLANRTPADMIGQVQASASDSVALWLDQPSWLRNKVDYRVVMGNYANQVLASRLPEQLTDLNLIQELLVLILDTYNLEAFNLALDRLWLPTYATLNHLLVKMTKLAQKSLGYLVQRLGLMLVATVDKGSKIDLYQLDMLRTAYPALVPEIERFFQRPEWQRLCGLLNGKTGNVELPVIEVNDLRTLAYQLHLDNQLPLAELCLQIRQLSLADPETLKQAAINRQVRRINDLLAKPQDFVGQAAPSYQCHNPSAYQYPDLDIVAYYDGQQTWCFTREIFENLLVTKTNPYNQQALPEKVINEVNSKLASLKTLGLAETKSLPYDQALALLNQPEGISNSRSEKYGRQFVQLASVHRVKPEKWKAITPTQVQKMLASLGVGLLLSDLQMLVPGHLFISLARTSLPMLAGNPSASDVFFGLVGL